MELHLTGKYIILQMGTEWVVYVQTRYGKWEQIHYHVSLFTPLEALLMVLVCELYDDIGAYGVLRQSLKNTQENNSLCLFCDKDSSHLFYMDGCLFILDGNDKCLMMGEGGKMTRVGLLAVLTDFVSRCMDDEGSFFIKLRLNNKE